MQVRQSACLVWNQSAAEEHTQSAATAEEAQAAAAAAAAAEQAQADASASCRSLMGVMPASTALRRIDVTCL